jgi:hypothetical protein
MNDEMMQRFIEGKTTKTLRFQRHQIGSYLALREEYLIGRGAEI